MKFRKIINFRFLFFLFVLSIWCIFFTSKLFISPFYIIPLLIPIICLIVYCIIKHRFICLSITCIILCFLSTFIGFYIDTYKDNSYNDSKITLTGKVSYINYVNDRFCYVLLTNNIIMRNNDSTETNNIRGNISIPVNIKEELNFERYDLIEIPTEIGGVELIEDNAINTFLIKNNIKYESKVISSNVISVKGRSLTVLEKFREYNRGILNKWFGEKKGNLAYAMLYGDKTFTEKDFLNQFRISGVAHIFTVSGLHISVIVLLLSYLLKKLKLSNKINFVVNFIFLFLFSTLCGFAPSVLRASIMALALILSTIFEKKYDILNSISMAGILILLLNPISYFDLGFQMSFAAVFGIILFGSIFRNIQIKNKFLGKVFALFTISLSAQIGLLPIFATYFGTISTWSLIANLLIIPLFSLFYPIFFITNLISICLPFLSFILFLPSAFIDVIIFINNLMISLPLSIIQITPLHMSCVILYYFTLFFISKYVVIHSKYKIILSSISAFVIIMTSIITSIPKRNDRDIITFNDNSSNLGTMLEFTTGERYLINPNLSNSKSISRELMNLNISTINAIIISNNQQFESNIVVDNLFDICSVYYLPKDSLAKSNLEYLDNSVIEVADEMIVVDSLFSINYFYSENNVSSILFKRYDKRFAIFNEIVVNSTNKNIIKSDFNFHLDCVKIDMLDKDLSFWQECLTVEKFVFTNSGKQVIYI